MITPNWFTNWPGNGVPLIGRSDLVQWSPAGIMQNAFMGQWDCLLIFSWNCELIKMRREVQTEYFILKSERVKQFIFIYFYCLSIVL